MSRVSSQNNRRHSKRVSRQQGDFGEYLQPILITSVLYPLKRIQTNLQIKLTYTNEQIKHCKQFITRCTHYGIRSLFRGISAYFIKVSIPYVVYHSNHNLGSTVNINNVSINKQVLNQAINYCLLAAAYTFIYPFENARVRMGSDIEQHRVYKNVRDCFSKMRKIEGNSSFFRGYALSLPYILLQYGTAINIYKYLLKKQKQQTYPTILKQSNGFLLFMISYLSSQILLYPLDSIRKIVQINGSLNHQNMCIRYRDVFKFHNFINFYQGFGIKIFTGFLYSSILFGLQKRPDLY